MNSEYIATIVWNSTEENFKNGKYSRAHTWHFDGGIEIPASSSPHVVPLPFSDPTAVDPEEAFIASLSSCHMLWFLSIAAKNGYIALKYVDEASGIMGENEDGKISMLSVTLKPNVLFSGEKIPSNQIIEDMHKKAHSECFIANSVKTKIFCHPNFSK